NLPYRRLCSAHVPAHSRVGTRTQLLFPPRFGTGSRIRSVCPSREVMMVVMMMIVVRFVSGGLRRRRPAHVFRKLTRSRHDRIRRLTFRLPGCSSWPFFRGCDAAHPAKFVPLTIGVSANST